MDDKNVPKYIKRNKRKGKVLPKYHLKRRRKKRDLIQKKGNELNLVYQKKKRFYKNKQFHLKQKRYKKKK